MLDFLNAAILGIIEGITEWLPISSTGHLILAQLIFPLRGASVEFVEMFDVVVQLGAILAVVVLFWSQLWPFCADKSKNFIKKDVWNMWFHVLVALIPTVLVALPFEDWFDAHFYNYQTVAFTLILYGILFIIIENFNKNRESKIHSIDQLTYKTAFLIGLFQVLSIIPGTSRSGATILGALLLCVARPVAAKFTFFLAVPTMLGASLLKTVKFASNGASITSGEVAMLVIGTISAFLVSMLAINFLMKYVQKHDFKVFGWYRIVLGIIVFVYFFLAN